MKNYLSHVGDIFAIPFFAALVYYFWQLENKTEFEWILFGFSGAGLLCDLYFTYVFLLT
jgi:hypothetical protein